MIRKYPNSDCFPEMISYVSEDFPKECFGEYKKKIDELLIETDVRKYQESVYHLKKCKR